MELWPTSPAGEWRFSCRPIGAELYASFFPVICVGIALAAGESLIGTSGTDRAPLGAPAVVLIVAILVHARRIGVWADADRVVVQNFWKTYEFTWADVSRIEIVPFSQSRYNPGWIFRMREGRGILASGVPLVGGADAADDLKFHCHTTVEIAR